jgi:hypothetical protein
MMHSDADFEDHPFRQGPSSNTANALFSPASSAASRCAAQSADGAAGCRDSLSPTWAVTFFHEQKMDVGQDLFALAKAIFSARPHVTLWMVNIQPRFRRAQPSNMRAHVVAAPIRGRDKRALRLCGPAIVKYDGVGSMKKVAGGGGRSSPLGTERPPP